MTFLNLPQWERVKILQTQYPSPFKGEGRVRVKSDYYID